MRLAIQLKEWGQYHTIALNSNKTAMPFKKGQSGSPEHKMKKGQTLNPNGRPKKLPQLDKLLDDVLGEEKDGLTAAEAILKALRSKAAKGDIRAAEILLDRAYGKARQIVDVEASVTTKKAVMILPNGMEIEI